jgi:outer membrane lipoprotein-sorting protein
MPKPGNKVAGGQKLNAKMGVAGNQTKVFLRPPIQKTGGSKMKKTGGFALAGAVAVLMAVGSLTQAASEDAKQIMKKSQDAMKISNIESTTTLVIKDDKGNQRIRKFSSATKDYPKEGVKKTLMHFVEPADVKGTGFLTFEYTQTDKDNDMWLYMPALRKTRRIVSSEKTKSFMGSEFTNSDITAPKFDDFTYASLPDEKIAEVDCWKIECKPANPTVAEDNGYSKKISWVGKSDYIMRKTEFYDQEGKLLKVLTAGKIKVLDKAQGLFQATDMTMENVQNGRKSQFLIDKSALNSGLKDELFTTGYLGR